MGIFYITNGDSGIPLSTLVLPTSFLISPTLILLVIFPTAIYEIKSSVLMKHLRASTIKS
jgi:hypothetical protein